MENNTQFIPLQEATKHCNYSQEYLSLRARQGKLKSIKIGRNWVTKKEWIDEYLKTFGGKEIEKKITPQFKKAEPPSNLPIETLDQRFQIPIAIVFGSKIRLRFIVVFIFILFSGGIFLLGQTKPAIFPERIKDTYKEATRIVTETISDEIQASTINIFKEYAFWLKRNIEFHVPGFKTIYLATDNFVNKKINQFSRSFTRFYQLVFAPEEKPEIEKPEELEVKEGIIVVPSEGKDEETKKKIKEAFSDEVRVEIEDETSGFIVPIFKEKEGEKYLYIMVPVKN